jgi:hypothetical protein
MTKPPQIGQRWQADDGKGPITITRVSDYVCFDTSSGTSGAIQIDYFMRHYEPLKTQPAAKKRRAR